MWESVGPGLGAPWGEEAEVWKPDVGIGGRGMEAATTAVGGARSSWGLLEPGSASVGPGATAPGLGFRLGWGLEVWGLGLHG